jgi:Zn finger protein HypA/HybF involved in hydrogenase expression
MEINNFDMSELKEKCECGYDKVVIREMIICLCPKCQKERYVLTKVNYNENGVPKELWIKK